MKIILDDPKDRIRDLATDLVGEFLDQHGQDDDLYAKILAYVEPQLIRQLLLRKGKNQSEAARCTGLNRGTFRTKMKQYGLLKGGELKPRRNCPFCGHDD